MKQMILEFRHPGLTMLPDTHILSSKRWYADYGANVVLGRTSGNFPLPQIVRGCMKLLPSCTKLRGGYYTPEPLARFLSQWAIRSRADSVLEPSCGDGVFISAAAERLALLRASGKQIGLQITGVEVDKAEAAKALARLRARGVQCSKGRIYHGDFFSSYGKWRADGKFDVVLGNPPFIRYQNFPENQRVIALHLMREIGLRPNRLTNAWVPFLVCAALLLKEAGRLAMVIPAELLQVTYAAEVRQFLSEYFDQITVITFRRLIFEGIQQEVLLLLAERGQPRERGIEVVELDSPEQLLEYKPEVFGKDGFKPVDHSTEKWTQYFLSEEEIGLIREMRASKEVTRLGQIADTDVGVVTGMNDFFILTDERAKGLELNGFAHPSVCRSNQLAGLIFKKSDWRENARCGGPAHLLNLPKVDKGSFPKILRDYIELAESQSLHLGYKCSIRKPWYAVPSVYAPGGFLLRQIHNYPKLVVNESGATCTDTIHRVRFRDGTNKRQVAAAFLNSLTFAFSEILGRSYGGGVLELEPNEADKLPIPLRGAERLDPLEQDRRLRAGDIDALLADTDRLLLRDGVGLSKRQVDLLQSIWKKLRARRLGRKVDTNLLNKESVNMGRHPLIS